MKHKVLTKDGVKVVDLNRRRAVRYKCLDCSGFHPSEVDHCGLTTCPLHKFRFQSLRQDPQERNWAIRKFCVVCMGGEKAYVKNCESVHCPLWPYRMAAVDKSREIT